MNRDWPRDMPQVDFQSNTNPSRRAVRGTLSNALAETALPASMMMDVGAAAFAQLDCSPPEFRAPKSEADFEAELQEFCRFARLGFTILRQSKPQLVDVANLLRSVGDGKAADDVLKLVISGRDKAEMLLELTTAAKLRCETAFLNGATQPAA
jgi:hypothetical protein